MKKRQIAVIGLVLLASCQSKPEKYSISATVVGNLKKDAKVYLKTSNIQNQWISVDTTTVVDGAFSFTGVQSEPQMHYITVESTRGNIPLVLENKDISIQFQKDSLSYAKVEGSRQNEWLSDFFSANRRLSRQLQSMQKDMRQAVLQKDTATATALREEYLEFQDEIKNFKIDFIEENPEALISAILTNSLLSTRRLPNSAIRKLYKVLSPEMKASIYGVAIKEQLDKMKSLEIGAVAPKFSGPTPEGGHLALSDVKGKLILVDFWAAWCRPCRIENPNVVSLYKKYHDKGLEVIGVSLDTNVDRWKNAIAADGLTWHHVSHLKRFRDPIAQGYKIRAIPATFLLDENGVIVAKNLRGSALEQKVAELLQ